MMDKSLMRGRIELLLLFALYLVVLPRVYMDHDMSSFREWALFIHHHGISHVYDSPTVNYHPLYLYALYIYGLLQGSDAAIAANMYTIKSLFVFFDFLPLFVLCMFRQRILNFKIPYLYLLLNIAYVFNSMVWGQADSMYTNLAFLSIIVALVHPTAAIMLFVMALNTKAQSIIFLPALALSLFYRVRSLKTAFTMVIPAAILQLLILIPIMAGSGLSQMVQVVRHSVDFYHHLSICAFNLWYIIIPGNPYFINDTDTLFLLSYKAIGLLLFFTASALVLAPLLHHFMALRQKKEQPSSTTYSLLFLGTGLTSLFFFYFNSQMHERYAHPIIIFFFFYAVTSGNYRLYILASIPYFLSLDKCFPDYLPIVHYKIIFASRIIAIWYTATVVYGCVLYYRLVKGKGGVIAIAGETAPPIN